MLHLGWGLVNQLRLGLVLHLGLGLAMGGRVHVSEGRRLEAWLHNTSDPGVSDMADNTSCDVPSVANVSWLGLGLNELGLWRDELLVISQW